MSLFHLIAPSGYCIKQHAALRGIQRLTDAGHQVNNVEVIARRCERFAGTETERLEDLNSLARLTTPNTIVLAVRGGYGASRLLADIDWQALVARQQHDPLLICGHSDFTAIQCGLLAQGNVITFSGPMLVANFGADELNAFTEHHFWLALRNKTFTIEWQGEGPTCQTEGTLWGGNLAMLISLIGTPWMPKLRTVSRYWKILTSTLSASNVCCCSSIMREFCHVRRRLFSVALAAARPMIMTQVNFGVSVRVLRSRLSIPLITGLDFGHEQRTVTLPLGAHAILNNTREGTQLTISGHPVLKM